MWTNGKALVLLMLMQSFAYAEDLNANNASQELPKRQTSRVDYLSSALFVHREEKTNSAMAATPLLGTESSALQQKSPSLGELPQSGLHWVNNGERPALEYRMPDDGTVRLHLGKHGTQLSAGWKF